MPRWDWHTAAGPPGSRISALAPSAKEAEVALPAPGEPVSFETHIKPLFRERDRQSMRSHFDLWSYDDVREHADAISEKLRDGSMPCDGGLAAGSGGRVRPLDRVRHARLTGKAPVRHR